MDKELEANHKRFIAQYLELYTLFLEETKADTVYLTDGDYIKLFIGYLNRVQHLIVPDDPKIRPRPKNLPYWNMVIRRTDPGMKVRKIYLDRENTKIPWFSKSLQWISVAKELVVENVDGPSYLPIEHASIKKPVMLDIADIFTYSIAREFSGASARDYGHGCISILSFVPGGHYVFLHKQLHLPG